MVNEYRISKTLSRILATIQGLKDGHEERRELEGEESPDLKILSGVEADLKMVIALIPKQDKGELLVIPIFAGYDPPTDEKIKLIDHILKSPYTDELRESILALTTKNT